jgi:hypothetical protein
LLLLFFLIFLISYTNENNNNNEISCEYGRLFRIVAHFLGVLDFFIVTNYRKILPTIRR